MEQKEKNIKRVTNKLMRYDFGKTIVIALGGSIAFPDGVNVEFIKHFKKLLGEFIKEGKKFVLIIGGGKLARVYQAAASELAPLKTEERDWVGIHATHLNAQFLHIVFGDLVSPTILNKRGKTKRLHYPITIGGGWQPGWSTDYVASIVAYDLGVSEFIIAGKPEYVYEKDPQLQPKAKPISHLSWVDYQKLIPRKWTPGMGAPVDPVAAKFARAKKLKALVVGGKDLNNFRRLLKGQDFEGTLIR